MHVSYSLNSLKVSYIGDYIGTSFGDIEGDTRSLDYSACSLRSKMTPGPTTINASTRT